MRALAPFLFALCLTAGIVRAEVICTLIMDATSGEMVLEEGACATSVTPASTFKLPLAVVAFEAGILEDGKLPVLSFAAGDPDWGGENWTRDTTPRDWMRFSVVWYSQRLTRALGTDLLELSLQDFGFGNADMSGDKGRQNGLDGAWLSSSLQVSPHGQSRFLRGLLTETLPVSKDAMVQTRRLLGARLKAGWRMQGKTGGTYPRLPDGAFDYARGVGWYVGWAKRGGNTLVFVRLTLANEQQDRSPGLVARAGFEADWPAYVELLGL